MSRAGLYIQQIQGYKAFIPHPLPPNPPLVVDEELLNLLSSANLALGKLAGLTPIISNPALFVYQFALKEALLSSQIEGTQCSLEDVLGAESPPSGSEKDIEEVFNYMQAMQRGLARLKDLPICVRLIKEMHTLLMQNVRGGEKTPGEFRITQNWIGSPTANLQTADFVPPPPHLVSELMTNLENFIHAQDKIPHLLKAAVIHAQFETIHPFLDGNGRLGRLLITYLLCSWNILEKPILYLSYFFKTHRSEYYARLMEVRFQGHWEEWAKFFCRAVIESSAVASATAVAIHELHKNDLAILERLKVSLFTLAVFNAFCKMPISPTQKIAAELKTSYPKVQRAIQALVDLNILQETSGKQRNKQYAYVNYLSILTKDTKREIG